jgi:hypothetical protein
MAGSFQRRLDMRKILYILAIIALILMSIPSPVQAVSANLTVAGDGYQSPSPAGTYYGVPANFNGLNLDDGDTSYLLMDYTGGEKWHFWTFSACPSATISSVTFYHKERWFVGGGTGSSVDYVRIGSNNFMGNFRGLSDSYTLYSTTWATNPATGLAWTKADVDSAQFGLKNTYPVYVTYAYLVVDYVATAPSVSTSVATSVAVTTATLNGAVTNINGSNVNSEGFVWDTASHDPLASTNVTPGNGYASWWYQNGTYGAGAFNHALIGLTSGQTYYYRTAANNTYGWNYGDEVSFATIGTPSVTTSVATYISTTVARLNASVTNSNGQVCDVRFGYDTVSHAGNFAAYASKTTWVNDTYLTGNMPYADLIGLTLGTPYFFNVQIENDAGIGYGTELTFTTATGLNPPTNFIAIPYSSTITLSWTQGVGSSLTQVRASPSTYPNTTADGTLVYLGALSSVTYSNLTAGTTYYFSAWGGGGGLFSTSKATTLGTTTAGSVTTFLTVPVASSSTWVAMPSELGLVNFPLYAYGNFAFDAYQMPRATGWVILYVFFCLTIGVLIYMKAPSNNLLLSGMAVGLFLFMGSAVTPALIPLWATFIYVIIFATVAWVANRY